jgi:hypothetical protein
MAAPRTGVDAPAATRAGVREAIAPRPRYIGKGKDTRDTRDTRDRRTVPRKKAAAEEGRGLEGQRETGKGQGKQSCVSTTCRVVDGPGEIATRGRLLAFTSLAYAYTIHVVSIRIHV